MVVTKAEMFFLKKWLLNGFFCEVAWKRLFFFNIFTISWDMEIQSLKGLVYFVWSGVVWGTYAWSVAGFQSRCFMRIFDVHFKTAWWGKKKIKEILKYQENGAWRKRKVAVLIKGKCKTRAIETNKWEEKPDDLNVSTTFTLHCAAERCMKTRCTWLCTGPRNRTIF